MRSAQLRAYQRTGTYKRAKLRRYTAGLRISMVLTAVILIVLHII